MVVEVTMSIVVVVMTVVKTLVVRGYSIRVVAITLEETVDSVTPLSIVSTACVLVTSLVTCVVSIIDGKICRCGI